MARNRFGQTWWGSQWLNALEEVDWDNRLPRGRRYANNGSVRSLSVDGRTVTAKVQGRRAQAYRVHLAMPPLSSRKVGRLADDLASDSALISQLLNRTLDPQVLDYAEARGIALFPETWQDLDMDCSCPDWAVPCKHLAAVIYLLSREIDTDPFQVFRLRGVDLIAELERRGLHLGAAAETELPDAHALITGKATPSEAAAGNNDPLLLQRIDYARLRPLRDALLRALPDDPGFAAAGRVRQAWKAHLGRVMRHARGALQQLSGDAAHDPGERLTLARDVAPRVSLDKALSARVQDMPGCDSVAQLVADLSGLRAGDLDDYDPRVGGWYAIRMAALHLLAAGAAVPCLFRPSRGETGAIWLPAALDPEVQKVLRQLAQGLPPGLLQLRQGRKDQPLPAGAQALAACGLFMDHWIRQWAELSVKQRDDKTLRLLFEEGRARFDQPGEAGTAERMHLWLARLQLAERDCLPVLRIAERRNGNGFNLHVDVEDRRGEARGSKPVPLKTVLSHADTQRESCDL